MTLEISISKNVAPLKWNECLKQSEFGNFFQTEEYAQYLKALGRTPFFVRFLEHSELKGMVLVFLCSQVFPGWIYNKITSPFLKLFSNIMPSFWSFNGPVAFDRDSLFWKAALYSLRFHLFGSRSRVQLMPPPLADFPEGFLAAGFRAKPLMTSIIDLREDFATLKKKMNKRSAFKNAVRAMKRGVQVLEVSSNREFEIYYNLLKESRKRLRMRPYAKSQVFPFLDLIRQGIVKCFVAVKGEKPLAGIMVSTFNGYLNELGAAQALEDIHEHYYGNDLLRFHIIKWGHESGHRYYDQTGLSLKTQKDLGIFRYKIKWGGKIIRYNAYTL